MSNSFKKINQKLECSGICSANIIIMQFIDIGMYKTKQDNFNLTMTFLKKNSRKYDFTQTFPCGNND